MAASHLKLARKVCLGFPEATEKVAWGAPTFRVKDKLFAMYANDHHGDGRIALWVKAPPGEQAVLVGADPDRFFVPPYVGPSGWVGVRLDRGIGEGELAEIVEAGYRMTAPKKLLAAAPTAPPAAGTRRPRPATARRARKG